MNQWRRLLIRLYPAAWRRRYAEEFLALLETRPLTRRDAGDILRGALDAHLHPELTGHGGSPVQSRMMFRIAGSGAILSTLLIALGLLNSARMPENETEFLLLIAPITLLPTAVALHLLFRQAAPRLSKLTAAIGLVSLGAYLLATIIGTVSSLLGTADSLQPGGLAWLFQGLIAAIGLWQLLTAFLGWRPKTVPFAVLGLIGVGGLAWLLIFAGILLNNAGVRTLPLPPAALMGFSLMIWLIVHVVWTVWLGVWLWQQGKGAPELPVV